MAHLKTAFAFLLAAALTAHAQNPSQTKAAQKDSGQPPAEDISGMYSFLNDGEFLQINLEPEGVSGYVSRRGDRESDRGAFLDQFFSKASVHGHDVAFTTKMLHGVWFEFKGRFDRGPGKSKSEDAYYVLRGTLTEFSTAADKTPSSRSRQVEFKFLAQPDDDQPAKDKQLI